MQQLFSVPVVQQVLKSILHKCLCPAGLVPPCCNQTRRSLGDLLVWMVEVWENTEHYMAHVQRLHSHLNAHDSPLNASRREPNA